MIKVGMIGAGCMGGVHAAAYKRLTEARLVTICDLKREKAEKLAGDGVQVVTDYHDILQDPEIDVVDVCLPTYLHKKVVLEAAAAGKHVFCEKPIARSVEDAEAMVKACKDAGVKLGVGHVVRFFPDYYKVKDVLAGGAIGEAKVIRASRGGAFPAWPEDNWYADYAKSGGPIVDLIIHDFDFLRWVFGPVKRVFAKSLTGKHHMLDHALVTLRFENGIIAHVEGSWAQPPGTPFATTLEIAGTKGLYEYSNQDAMPIMLRTAEGEARASAVPESPLAVEPYTAQLQAFIKSIIDNTDVPVPGEEAIEALKIALAACESAETGEVVWLGGAIRG